MRNTCVFLVLLLEAHALLSQPLECPDDLQPLHNPISFVDPNSSYAITMSVCSPTHCAGSSTCTDSNCCSVCQSWGTGGACLGYLTAVVAEGTSYNLYYQQGGDPVVAPEPGLRQTHIKLTCGNSPFTLTRYIDGGDNKQDNIFWYYIEGTSSYACNIPKCPIQGNQVFNVPTTDNSKIVMSVCEMLPTACTARSCDSPPCCYTCQSWDNGGACLGAKVDNVQMEGEQYIITYSGGDPVIIPPTGPRISELYLKSGGNNSIDTVVFPTGPDANGNWVYKLYGTYISDSSCSFLNSCTDCAADSNCAWCLDSNRCEVFPPNCGAWCRNPNDCPLCATYKSCNACAGSSCNWCNDTSVCSKNPDGKCGINIRNPEFCKLN